MPDPFEIQRAIRNAENNSLNYDPFRKQTKPHDYSDNDGPTDYMYWKRRFEQMHEEMWQYRRESWKLRDELLDLREIITKALERKR